MSTTGIIKTKYTRDKMLALADSLESNKQLWDLNPTVIPEVIPFYLPDHVQMAWNEKKKNMKDSQPIEIKHSKESNNSKGQSPTNI